MNHKCVITVGHRSIRVHECVVQVSVRAIRDVRVRSHLRTINGECEICGRYIGDVVIHYTIRIDSRAFKHSLSFTSTAEAFCSPENIIVTFNSDSESPLKIVASCHAERMSD